MVPAAASQEPAGSGLQHPRDQVHSPMHEQLGSGWVPIPEGPHLRHCLASPPLPCSPLGSGDPGHGGAEGMTLPSGLERRSGPGSSRGSGCR